MQDATPPGAWHALDTHAALAALNARAEGLTDAEAARRLAAHGPNRLPEGKRRGPLRRFLAQFADLFIYLLLGSAALAAALGETVDAAVILAVVLINAVIGFVQEGRAEQALAAIRGMLDPHAAVLRDGRRADIAAEALVPGDVVLLEAGDRVPADLRLLSVHGLRVEEAALTGESVPVDKAAAPVGAQAALAERAPMAYAGCMVAAGTASGLVVATGPATELGRISALVGETVRIETPLLRQIARFARALTVALLGLCAIAFAFAWGLRGYPAGEAFMIVVGLLVAAIPEGLPAIMTITLAIGVSRMASRNAVIRRLPAVETLGAVSVICSDKTGTLTRNEMSARALRTPDGAWEAEGDGYAPTGRLAGAAGVDPTPALRAGLLCNDAELVEEDGEWRVAGDPMEGALVALAARGGLDTGAERRAAPRLDAIPFDARHRYMATLHAFPDGRRALIKGAPEAVLALCDADAAPWEAEAERLAAQGQRVLAFAEKDWGDGKLTPEGLSGARLLGLVGFIDPPRPEAVAAVAECRAAGVRVVMITGDHVATARAIAAQLGLAEAPVALTGAELDALDADAFAEAARRADVFARTTPEHKLRLVEALQADGRIVAMTGDGANDAPALKRADVGVAMGRKGTEAAKQAAQMVLADDNFASIAAAVREGRTVHDNLMKVIAWTLPTNGGEALTILAALALGLALPITPVQILWVNMVTAVALGLTLAFEPTEPGAMRRPPRDPAAPILSRALLGQVAFVSALLAAGCFGLFTLAKAQGQSLEVARTMAVNALVAMELFYLFSARFAHGSALSVAGLRGTPAVWIGVSVTVAAQTAFTYLPAANVVFGSAPLGFGQLALTAGAGVCVLLAAEARKALARRGQ